MNLKQHLHRADWLRELHLALIACTALLGVGLVFNAVSSCVGPLGVRVPHNHVLSEGATQLNSGSDLAAGGQIDVSITNPNLTQALFGLLGRIPSGLVALAMLLMLIRVVRDARRSDPFSAVTVTRLRWISGVVIVGGLIAWVVQTVAELALSATVTDAGPGGTFSPLPALMWVLLGMAYLTVAELISRGQAMRAELAEVI